MTRCRHGVRLCPWLALALLLLFGALPAQARRAVGAGTGIADDAARALGGERPRGGTTSDKMREPDRRAKTEPELLVPSQVERLPHSGAVKDGKRVYVEVGPMADSSVEGSSKLPAMMRAAVERSIVERAPSFMTQWPSGRSPSRADLSDAGTVASFYVDGALTQVQIARKGPVAELSCKVSLLVATFPDKSMFAFPSGTGAVTTDSSAQAIEEGKRDCVLAVLGDVVQAKVVPVMEARLP